MPRLAAALIALVCWGGLSVQFAATYGRTGDVGLALWAVFRFFTIITNLFVAIAMTRLALGWRVSPFVLGGLTLAILLVGVVYTTLLRGLVELSGGALLADTLLHKVSPVLTVLYWLLFGPRGRLRWSAPFWWGVYPLAYFAYALARGAVDGRYPYPFMDVGKIGWAQTGLNAVLMATAFIVAGLGLVWLDRRLPLGSRRANS